MEQTKRLYEQDPYLKECSAKVIAEQARGDDGLYQVILDQTVFYPTGGGQPHDEGYINEIKVIDVYKEEGVVYHILESSLNGAAEVIAKVDWQLRIDHMQQHAGQHILSRAFEIIADAETVGFHLGEDTVTIDLTLGELSEEIITAVEDMANNIVAENKGITTELLTVNQAPSEIKNKIPELEDTIRIVTVNDFDSCACSGTHPNSSIEVGSIKVLGFEKYKQKIRVTFVCGKRAFNYYRSFQQKLMDTAAILKTNWTDVKASVVRLIDEKERLDKQTKEATIQLLKYEVEAFKAKAKYKEDFFYVEYLFNDRDINEIRHLAQGITDSQSYVVLFINLTSDKVQFMLQRSDNLTIKMNECLKIGLEIIDGKGGGNPKLAQGGGSSLDKMNEAIEAMRGIIFNILT